MEKKTTLIYMLLIRDTLRSKDMDRLKVKRWRKIFHANRNKKKTGVAILISHKYTSKQTR